MCRGSLLSLSGRGQERRAEARLLLSMDNCCLDAGLGRKLKEKFGDNVDALFEEDFQSFLYTMYCRVVVSTALIECTFASFRRWLIKAGTSVANDNIASRHTLQMFTRAYEKLNPHRKVGASVLGSRAKRPPWVKKARAKLGYKKGLSGRDVFYSSFIGEHAGGFSQAAEAWNQLSKEERRRFNDIASGKRAVFHHLLDPIKLANSAFDEVQTTSDTAVKTPWNLGNAQWPLKPETVEQALQTPGFIKNASKEWSADYGIKRTYDPTFPDDVRFPEYCLNKLPQCVGKYGAGILDRASKILNDVKAIICPRRSAIDPGQYLLVSYLDLQQVVVIFSYLKAPFTFECLALPTMPKGTDVVGTDVSLRVWAQESGGLEPTIQN